MSLVYQSDVGLNASDPMVVGGELACTLQDPSFSPIIDHPRPIHSKLTPSPRLLCTPSYLPEYAKLLSPTCMREFPHLEFFFCLGCNPQQPNFVDVENKQIRICKGYYDQIWAASSSTTGDQTTDSYGNNYDLCGITDTYTNNVTGVEKTKVILPSNYFGNNEAAGLLFLNHFKPPFFEDYNISISTSAEDKAAGRCFSNGALRLAGSTAMWFALSAMALWVMESM